MTKLAIIYYSATGHGTTMAKRVAAAAESAGAEVRVRHVAETREPESFARNPAWTAKTDKVYAAWTSTESPHGGQETTLISLYLSLMHWGGILVPPGYTDPVKFNDGNPYGVSLVATHDNITEFDDATAAALGTPGPARGVGR